VEPQKANYEKVISPSCKTTLKIISRSPQCYLKTELRLPLVPDVNSLNRVRHFANRVSAFGFVLFMSWALERKRNEGFLLCRPTL